MAEHFSYYFEELIFKFSLDPESGRSAPPWLENAEFPPLPPRRAIDATRKLLHQMFIDYTPIYEPEFHSCSLRQTSDFEGGWWYYLVSWTVWPPDCEGDRSNIDVPILMNGRCPPYQVFKFEDRLGAWKS